MDFEGLSSDDSQNIDASGEVISPRKRPKLDFFAELKKAKAEGPTIRIKDLKLGRNITQEIKVAVVWRSRNNEKYVTFHGHDGNDLIVFKAFAPAMNRFIEELNMFRTYKFKNFLVASVNEKYKHDGTGTFEIIVSNDTLIEELDEVLEFPFNPVGFDMLDKTDPGTSIDALGIVVQVGEIRTTSQSKKVREYSLVDRSEKTISLYLWGKDAEDIILPLHKPIRLRNVIVRHYSDERVIWFQSLSSIDVVTVDKDGTFAAWFRDVTKGLI